MFFGKKSYTLAVEADASRDVQDPNLETKFISHAGRFIRKPSDPVVALKHKLSNDAELHDLIERSINKAKNTASRSLDKALYNALDWPCKLGEYYVFLEKFAHWTPQQSGNEVFISADDPDEYQEAYVRLCHFYYLIDQPVLDDGKTVIAQNNDWFRKWLAVYADYWGSYLDTPDSFNSEILKSFQKYSPLYAVEDSMIEEPIVLPNGKQIGTRSVPNNPSGWVTFNQFFARELNGGLRPITNPTTNAAISCPADCTFKETFPIGVRSNVMAKNPDGVRLKKFHRIGNVHDLLKDSPYKDQFAGGTFVHYFLNTFSYHRFHAPVAGTLKECRTIRGRVYLDVNIMPNGQFDAPDNAGDGYEFFQSRGLTIWDTTGSPSGDCGLVACLPIGMAQVSSSVMTGTVDKYYQKGEEFGYFQFGGSDIILLFQKDADVSLVATSPTDYLHYGTHVADVKLKA